MHSPIVPHLAVRWLVPLVLVVTAGCGQSSPTSPTRPSSDAAGCATVSALAQDRFSQLGGQTTLTVDVTSPACGWSLQTPDWIHLEPGSGVGSATVTVTVSPSDQTRQYTISTPPRSVTIFQAPQQTCSVSLQSDRTTFDESGGRATLQVTTSVPACDWQIFSLDRWIRLDRSSGSGNATVGAQIDPSERSVNGSILVIHDSTSAVASVDIHLVSRLVLPLTFSYTTCGSIQAGGPTKTDLCRFVVLPGQNPQSADIRVSGDLRPVGGLDGVWLLRDLNAGGWAFSLDLSVPAGVAAGSKNVSFTAYDAQGRIATATVTIEVLPPG